MNWVLLFAQKAENSCQIVLLQCSRNNTVARARSMSMGDAEAEKAVGQAWRYCRLPKEKVDAVDAASATLPGFNQSVHHVGRCFSHVASCLESCCFLIKTKSKTFKQHSWQSWRTKGAFCMCQGILRRFLQNLRESFQKLLQHTRACMCPETGMYVISFIRHKPYENIRCADHSEGPVCWNYGILHYC